VDEIVNTIRGIGEKVEEPMIEKKVLSSPPLIFDVKVSTIEEMNYMETNDGWVAWDSHCIWDEEKKKKIHHRRKKISKNKRRQKDTNTMIVPFMNQTQKNHNSWER